MANAAVDVGANVPAPDLNGAHVADSIDFRHKYAEERDKRLGKGGLAQFIDIAKSEQFKSLLEDPWIGKGTPINQVVQDGGHCKFLIVGAGYGGILFAVNLIKAGFKVDDLLIIDSAGGFGGTWYWNRYPGLMCDVESYIYLPMLEETGYMPKEKYASGEEIRLYAESICQKYDLHRRAMFQSKVDAMSWDAERKHWKAQIVQRPKGGEETRLEITSDFGILASGILSNPKVADIRGAADFKGDVFHTSRWDYGVTGGSSADPQLEELRPKRVGILGTGATAVQAVPHLARFAKELFVFQRTPSTIAERGNRRTDPHEWKNKIASRPGWQKARNANFSSFVSNADEKPEENLVDDGWTKMPSYSALIGGPSYEVGPENAAEHVARMHALDYPVQASIRKRAEEIVHDGHTAKSLQAWYYGWCKRPCFHDEYLQAFNQPNVTLVDTEGEGIDRVTADGIEANGKLYELDVLIWGTGYVSPIVGTPASKGDIHVTGKDGQTMDEQWRQGVSTLHGVSTRGFPNLFFPGPSQAAATPNFMFVIETLAAHVAYIVAKASLQFGSKPVIEPTSHAQEQWTMRILAGAATFASIAGCTPGYLNAEGASDALESPEEKMKAARASIWSRGIEDFVRVIEEWRANGKLEGLEMTAA